ncbi:MAG: 16S rRNA (guanine(966)-N(2))-methyltransferase RsmD [Deltaproteobacteria bacterium GWB2_42_7]|nr:MAG: 16S rRNA (guanine(966)-N(2))-methyltransferase RsmD [Deltaproteobacteria bacterium GWB2_42_7]
MRIIGGTAKGRRLASFRTSSIRPTTDRVRESIFNILPLHFELMHVLDLFAGTGAMGLEALSRGAKSATFIDSDPQAVKVIKKNLELCGFTKKAVIITRDVKASLNLLSKKREQFELIIIDPPYDTSLMGITLNLIGEKELLAKNGIVVAESSKRMVWDGEVKGIELFDRRKYGDTVVSFYRIMKQADRVGVKTATRLP